MSFRKRLLAAVEASFPLAFPKPFFECPIHPLDFGLCSCDNCPCYTIGTSIKRGEGFLFISKDVVDFRRDCLSRRQFMAKLKDSRNRLPNDTIPEETGLPILVCEQGARLLKLDLAVAHQDAKRWWENGTVPLRPTPTED
jgi:hypothetical protein